MVVLVKPANCPQREPVEGSEASDHGPLLRNTTNASKFGKRVNQTGADSNAGDFSPAQGAYRFAGMQRTHDLRNRML